MLEFDAEPQIVAKRKRELCHKVLFLKQQFVRYTHLIPIQEVSKFILSSVNFTDTTVDVLAPSKSTVYEHTETFNLPTKVYRKQYSSIDHNVSKLFCVSV